MVSLNVLEHVNDDHGALRRFHDLLAPGGRLALLVPAHPGLYCKMDEQLGHVRRYDWRDLKANVQGAGFQIERVKHFNPLGAIGWFLSGKVLRARHIGGVQVRLHRWLFPLARLLNRLNLPGLGLSHIVIARKA
ncbi:MAG: methyltransferase domain-containing protein [Candidatus Sumerlaeota bacterium]|nr:methyltransferase domain-containing protein [Candidatus Sumerlaeota bacterium]